MNWPCDDIEPPKRAKGAAQVVALLIAGLIVLFLFITVLRSVDAHAQEPLGTQVGWAAHPSMGIVIAYKVDGENVFYAHPVIAQGPLPECQGGMGKIKECVEVRQMIATIHLITMDQDMPYLYVADIIPTAKKVGSGEFNSLVSATWKECE